MSEAHDLDRVNSENVYLTEVFLGYDILVDDERVGSIEGVPGSLEHLEVKLHWEGKGVKGRSQRVHLSESRSWRLQGQNE